jgi:hypothetical protein
MLKKLLLLCTKIQEWILAFLHQSNQQLMAA